MGEFWNGGIMETNVKKHCYGFRVAGFVLKTVRSNVLTVTCNPELVTMFSSSNLQLFIYLPPTSNF